MSDAYSIIRQWLRTDQAFGVAEVPLVLPRQVAPAAVPQAVAPRQIPNTPAVTPARPVPVTPKPAPAAPPPTAVRPPIVTRNPTSATPPAPPPGVSIMAGLHNSGRDDMARKTIALPPPPAGKIAALPPLTRADKITQLTALEQTVKADLAGLLNDEIKNVVFGEGDPEAPIIFIGEGPGVEEDLQGRPFVGKSGQKLDEMIKAMGYAREQVYIANVVKVRCAAWSEVMHRMVDRPPDAPEAAAQLGYLFRQIEIIRPRAIVTLGNPALHFFLQLQLGILSVRGQWQDHRGIPAMPTFHPAYLLRNYTPETRNMMWSDLKQVMTLLAAK